MNKGCLLFAHDNGDVEYSVCAGIAAKLVNKHLKVPVSLVTDIETFKNFQDRFSSDPFDQVIFVDRGSSNNRRLMLDDSGKRRDIIWFNKNRNTVWDITPYERTLVLDVDMLILNDQLNQYWNSPYSFLICPGMNEITTTNFKPDEYTINPYSIPMMWATMMMFTKNKETETFFNLVAHIKENYRYYSGLYKFDHQLYRNDYVFSIACHIMSGNYHEPWQGLLPIPVLVKETSQLVKIDDEKLFFMIKDFSVKKDLIVGYQNQNIHYMNKWDLVKRARDFLTLVK